MVLDTEVPSEPMLNALWSNVEVCCQLALFLSVFHPDGLRGHEGSHRNSHFMPEGIKVCKNHAQSLFLQTYGLTPYWINPAEQCLGASGFDGCHTSLLNFVSDHYCCLYSQLVSCWKTKAVQYLHQCETSDS